jgi:hypothetical protein
VISSGYPVTSTNKTDRHDITEILLKVALDTITPNLQNIKGWDKNSGEDLLIYLYDIHNIKEVLCAILYFISVVKRAIWK